MGYSARYHAASLAAVFFALAVGILIGVGFGDDVVKGTAEDLEQSLNSDLNEARQQVGDLQGQLARERETSDLLYPAVVGDRLPGVEVAIVALGSLSEEISADIEDALEPTSATLQEVAVVGEPPDVGAATGAVDGSVPSTLSRGDRLELSARRAGRALAEGGPRFDDLRRAFLTRYSGQPGTIDAAVLVRQAPSDLDPREAEDADRLESGLVEGIRNAGVTVVGAERSNDDPSSIPAFNDDDVSSVDSVDLLAGRVALVLALDGAEGAFGIKDTADRLLPELLPASSGG